jgi:hypothetical protein
MSDCPRHPACVATDLCVECGDAVCGQCATVLADQRVFCPDCGVKAGAASKAPVVHFERREEQRPPEEAKPRFRSIPGGRRPEALGRRSSRAFAVFIIPLLSCVCFPLAVVGLLMGTAELRAIKAGKAPAAGRSYAMIGTILCAVEIVFWLAVLLANKGR